ncbi:Non-catalytic module family EXPN protein [Ganoderma leucocontextum]|nr:Non-catalytic module family EXPN protein [Ganoderma leucocontextum]
MHVLAFASVALTAAAGASAMMIPHRHTLVTRQEKPATYYEGYLENYKVYHTRYEALDCEAKHNTTFFDKCCHPMLATETLEKNRAAECNPANQVTSTASSAAPSQTDDDSDCEDEDPTPATSSAAPTATDDDGDDCDDDEPATTVTHSSTHAASSTQSSATHSEPPKTTQTPTTTNSPSSTTHSTTKASSTKTSTTKASSTKTTAPAATSTAASSGDFTGGHATFFWQGGQAGACGTVHSDNSFVAALQTKRYGDLSQQSSNCGRKITLTNTNNGKTVGVTVADACPTCGDQNDLDLSYEAFLQIATEAEGDVPIVWHFDD